MFSMPSSVSGNGALAAGRDALPIMVGVLTRAPAGEAAPLRRAEIEMSLPCRSGRPNRARPSRPN